MNTWRALVENAIRDTHRTWPYDSALANVPSVSYLLVALTTSLPHPPDRWRILANRAAAWLRDLTKDGAA